MKIAITSASGQLGRAIVEEAINEFGANNVIGIARTVQKAKGLGVEIRQGDYNNISEFNSALKGVDVVLLVSGMDHPDKRIEQHRNVIEAARNNGVRKIVYTSIFGKPGKCAFDDVILSNRKTEQDIIDSGLEYSIGRNGLYVEADIEAIPQYIIEGEIKNSAGKGKCGYTTRKELSKAYVNLIKNDDFNSGIYNLFGTSITQQELTESINNVYDTKIKYKALSPEEYEKDRKSIYGDFFGGVISGIYEGIRNGTFNEISDFEKVVGRVHQSHTDYILQHKHLELRNNTAKAISFYKMSYEGNPKLAVEKYVGEEYIQHNPDVADGTEGFIEYFDRMQREYPNKTIEFVRHIAQGDLVSLHTHQIWPDDDEYITMDFFRFDAKGKICEHWDSIQKIPTNPANENSMY